MTHRSGPSEYTAMRPTRIHVLYLATAATLALAAGAGAQERDALPQDGRVVAGKADLARHERSLTITQHSQRAILEWRSFDIGADAAVHFVQPDASAVVLNRVLGGQPSRIAGRLSGNGHVYLVNAAGVLFAPGAQVDVGRLVSTGLDIADSEFMASDGRFDQAAPEGLLPMAPGAGNPPLPLRVADPQAEDAEPPAGTGAAPGRGLLTLDAGAGGHLRIGLQPEQVQALVDEGGLQEDGGDLVLSDAGSAALVSSAVATGTTPQARGVAVRDGRVLLVAVPAGAAPAAPQASAPGRP